MVPVAHVSTPQPVTAKKPLPLHTLLGELGKTLTKVVIGMIAVSVLFEFPYHADVLIPQTVSPDAGKFYAKIYSDAPEQKADNEADYVKLAQGAIAGFHIVDRVRRFVRDNQLENKRVLDVGAGTGYLQDVVDNYVGLDISPSARSYYHKPYVQASATEMPFKDGEFDALWSIWVLEHVPKPEQALVEMRRVVKDRGLLYLLPAWNCTPWAAQGYPVRPYSDFGLGGKLVKTSTLFLASPAFRISYIIPTRVLRREYVQLFHTPTRLHYNLLHPNYAHYWMPDSDALNDIDFYEMMLWFISRGDECLNCGPLALLQGDELVIRVHKKPTE